MSNVEIPYLWHKGNAWYYRRARGRKWFTARIRRTDGTPLMPGQPGFIEAYERQHGLFEKSGYGMADRQPFGLIALAATYRSQPEFAKLSPVTKAHYIRRIGILEDYLPPDCNMAEIDRPMCLALRADLAKQSASAANEGMAMLGTLLTHAIDLGWRRTGDNPAKSAGVLETGEGYTAWKTAQVRKVLDHPDIEGSVKRLIACAYYTGLRRADLISLARGDRRNGVITCVTSKTGAQAYIPEHPELTRWLDGAPEGGPWLLTSQNGNPWTSTHASHAVLDAVRKAGLSGLSLHGLRKTRTIELVESGATDAEVESLIPHADPKMTKFYRAMADQKVLAHRANDKLNTREKEDVEN